MNDKLEPPAEVELIDAKPPVEPVQPESSTDMLPDVPPEQLLDLKQRAGTWASHVASLRPKTPEFMEQVRAIQNVARQEITASSNATNRFLQTSLQQAKGGGGSGHQADVAGTLVNLRNTVEELAPDRQDFFSRLTRALPFGNRMQRYFRQYESNQEQLNTILLALDRGQDMLRRDNAALAIERKTLWETMGELKKLDALLAELDVAVNDKIGALRASGDEQAASTMETEVLFAVRQRRMDVQTQIAVSVQSYLSMDLIQDNNLKLIDGVERAKTTTMTALRTAVIVAQALENQRLVLDQIDAVNRTTNTMIDRTSQLLRENAGRVQEQAVTSGVSIETLQRAYDNLFATLDEVETFRKTANENFATTITSLQGQVATAEPYLERARRAELENESGDEAGDTPALRP
ncbi:protein involved in tellurite resistance [Pseudoclavibacter endophyticus]|uniref:Toxic anion resistance protein n=1 Tax=Pseudoclavibacter endophyticus TaxID=1778590 RepID=A0A6H9WLV1_9MICO|nr:toxic anion resistance protein [Pseudoclavibacter endophyticus]KAB1649806.1 toxic anion resistance protein [Pseudoclavibacter endophyticus]GGA59612.1 protein involved in tellurite resistance [Pseudoclavibacter endophyticus]